MAENSIISATCKLLVLIIRLILLLVVLFSLTFSHKKYYYYKHHYYYHSFFYNMVGDHYWIAAVILTDINQLLDTYSSSSCESQGSFFSFPSPTDVRIR
jgi:hypothetical protein